MKSVLKITSASLLIIALLLGIQSFVQASTVSSVDACLEATSKCLAKEKISAFTDTRGEWLVTGLARYNSSDYTNSFDSYYKSCVSTLKENSGVISRNKYTEYSKAIIALTAIGKNPQDIGGYNLLNYLADYNRVKYQGINGVIWALIALDCKDYNIPSSTDSQVFTTRKSLIDYILDKELKGGGWAVAGNTADSDITAMTVTALSKYYHKDTTVKAATDRALTVLSSMQGENGEYINRGVENCESAAQVIVSLCSLGINPTADNRFIKRGKSLVDVLLEYKTDGGFSHTKNGEYNQMSTEQCFYSLVAYKRLLLNKSSIFDMNNASDKGEEQITTIKNQSTTTTENVTKPAYKSKNKNPSKVDKATSNIQTENPQTTATKPVLAEADTTINQRKIDSINKKIKVLTKQKASKKKKAQLEKILQEYNTLSPEDKEKVKGIEVAKKSEVKAKSEENSCGIIVVITLSAAIVLGVAVTIFILKRRKSKEEKI